MKNKKAQYITTTLPYVNADPHIGFAMEIIQADVIARWKELQGYEVFFNTGTDEHGQKVFKAAQKEGKEVQAYVDEYAEKFKSLKDKLGLHPNLHFIRTTSDKHIKAAQEMWKRCFAKGDIYKKKYRGLYCEGDEVFIKETDLVDGKCPNHPNLELQEIEEENYFFKITNYKEYLEKYIDESSVIPERRIEEAKSFVTNLEDISISRERSRLGWGVAVPDDDSQVMYVWFDALTSYISTLGWPEEKGDFNKFWNEGETLQLAGKDQVRFQSIIWQAMLKSAGVKATDKVFYHGFITSGNQKMSKSLGNVINPDELVKKYGTEATRYLLLRHTHPFEDTDITWERLDEWYEADLVNGLGNFVARVMKLAESYLQEPVVVIYEEVLIDEKMREFDFKEALGLIFGTIGALDLEIQNKKPWETKDKEVISHLVRHLTQVTNALKPFMPETSEKILKAIKENKKPENLFPRLNA